MSLIDQIAAALGTPQGNLKRHSVYLQTAAHQAQTREARRSLLRDSRRADAEVAASEHRFPAPGRRIR